MLNVKTNAEVRNINIRAETHGDQYVPAIDIKLMLLDVPCEHVTTFLPDWERFFNGDNLVLQELIPFKIHHKIENVDVMIDRFTLKGSTIRKGADMWVKPTRAVNLLVTIQSSEYPDALLTYIAGQQKELVTVEFIENQSTVLDEAG